MSSNLLLLFILAFENVAHSTRIAKMTASASAPSFAFGHPSHGYRNIFYRNHGYDKLYGNNYYYNNHESLRDRYLHKKKTDYTHLRGSAQSNEFPKQFSSPAMQGKISTSAPTKVLPLVPDKAPGHNTPDSLNEKKAATMLDNGFDQFSQEAPVKSPIRLIKESRSPAPENVSAPPIIQESAPEPLKDLFPFLRPDSERFPKPLDIPFLEPVPAGLTTGPRYIKDLLDVQKSGQVDTLSPIVHHNHATIRTGSAHVPADPPTPLSFITFDAVPAEDPNTFAIVPVEFPAEIFTQHRDTISPLVAMTETETSLIESNLSIDQRELVIPQPALLPFNVFQAIPI